MHGRSTIEPGDGARGAAGFTLAQREVLVRMIDARHERNRRFANRSKLFSDPAWDILIDLLGAELKAARTSITSACAASRVPHTTALRYIRLLETEGLISRRADAEDGRRMFLTVTPHGWAEVGGYVRWLDDRGGR